MKTIVYTNKDGVWENFVVILAQTKTETPPKNWWSLEHPVATGIQRKCDTISDGISCHALHSRANNIGNIEDTFHLYFDNDIIDKIVEYTNTSINETIARLQRSDNFNQSSKYKWVKKTNRVEIDALFGLMYFRGILGVNLHMTDRLFSNDSHFVFGAIMSKNRLRFLKGDICFDNPQEKTNLWTDSQLLERCGKSSIQIFQSMYHHKNIFQLMRHYTE